MSSTEQEHFLADTLAFLRKLAEMPAADIHPEPLATRRGPPATPKTDLRSDLERRLEAFRNTQRFLQIEREAHYAMSIQRIRAVTDQWAAT